jgi:hypothetical protein
MYDGVDYGPSFARVATALETLAGTAPATDTENAGARIAAALEVLAAIDTPAAASPIGRVVEAIEKIATDPTLLQNIA